MKLIGREYEARFIESVLRSGQHVLLEGPVGVGKTTLALSVSDSISGGNASVVRVDGDGRYTEQKLVGSFDPKLVLALGFVREAFLPGPLFLAMEEGAILLVNELNRMPEMVQNVLLPALDEGKIQIPNLGELGARPGFAVIATQNPREFVATSSLSEALLDRFEWVGLSELSRDEEIKVVRAYVPDLDLGEIENVVDLVRLTRLHVKIKRGASIRAGISMAKILSGGHSSFWEAAKIALANRIELDTGKFSNRSYSDLMSEILLELETELKKKT